MKLIDRLGQRAYEEVISQYSWPVVAEQLEGVYRAVSRTGAESTLGKRYITLKPPFLDADLGAGLAGSAPL